MKQWKKLLAALVVCLLPVLVVAQTNYNKTVMVNQANKFVDPAIITANGLLTTSNVVSYGFMTNGQSGVNFASLSVTANATNGTEVVNWQTMTGYVASVSGNFLTNGAAGTWTNLAAYYNDAGFLTNGAAGVSFGSLFVDANATNGTEAVNYQTMMNQGFITNVISDGSLFLNTWDGPTNILYIVDPTGAYTNKIGTFGP